MRVLAKNPELVGIDVGQSDILPERWRLITLEMTKPNGGKIDIRLLRPVEWLLLHAIKNDSVFDFPKFFIKKFVM